MVAGAKAGHTAARATAKLASAEIAFTLLSCLIRRFTLETGSTCRGNKTPCLTPRATETWSFDQRVAREAVPARMRPSAAVDGMRWRSQAPAADSVVSLALTADQQPARAGLR